MLDFGFDVAHPSFHCISHFPGRHLYPIMQTILIYFVYSQVLCPISIGKLYHWIRGQAMLKLYVLIAIVEVFDRLLCSFGQDAWDSLYWNTTRRPRHPRMFVSVSLCGPASLLVCTSVTLAPLLPCTCIFPCQYTPPLHRRLLSWEYM